ncbi:ribonuclease R [Microbulbifer sp. THAF38]|uniref:ribonuclease R n=1 Tax=Microbulbifer sp. THAF38 TaxID=2587856 RepID=UPI001269498D|nr:ribonuclease R [Microbulbifer sp. THAF38]QFT54911.1 Ribonuclease R [Microbulbifer sp. THAF38]
MNTAILTAPTSPDSSKYRNPTSEHTLIISLLEKSHNGLHHEELARALHLACKEQKKALNRRLRVMERDGQLTFSKQKGYGLVRADDVVSGIVIGHPDGFGFLSCDDVENDLYLSKTEMFTVFDGDRAQARISGIDHRGRQQGTIIKVLERNTTHVIGRLQVENQEYYIKPENSRIAHDIDVDSDRLMGAKAGQYVSVEIIHPPCRSYSAFGRVTELLGDAAAPGMEIEVTIRSHDIPNHWPQQAAKAAQSMGSKVTEADKLNRTDLRSLPFVTIDGEDARDFDDAVYCEKSKNGGWRLFVAIADVSHYVHPGSALDQEAKKRGTSVYFPGHVVPMLPETLSNGLCSLNPHVDRLVMVCEMTLNASGKMTDYKFSEGVIHSHARLTYNQVNALLTSSHSKPYQMASDQHAAITPRICELYNLYAVLRKARDKRGSMDFDKQEVQFQFTKDRKLDRIIPAIRNDAHRMIEEFMLCANVATARFLDKLKMPALYRVHVGPRDKKLASLRDFLGNKGLKLAGGSKPSPVHYNRLLKSIDQRVDADIIQTMMLRSLSQAEYSIENQGHFGLAYPAYAHFTSPIRRYPDLLVHRAIRSVIHQAKSKSPLRRALNFVSRVGRTMGRRNMKTEVLDSAKSYPYDNNIMQDLAVHCSMASRRADKANWEVEAWLKCEYMQNFVGDTFHGVISSVTHFGLFIELEDTQVEGLVHISALKDDFYHFDAVSQKLCGERSNNSYGLGDSIYIRVARVNMERRKIEFELATQPTTQKKSKVN